MLYSLGEGRGKLVDDWDKDIVEVLLAGELAGAAGRKRKELAFLHMRNRVNMLHAHGLLFQRTYDFIT